MNHQDVQAHRMLWNERHKELRSMLNNAEPVEGAIDLWLLHHAVLHTRKLDPIANWSYVDDISLNLSVEQKRRVPKNAEHSIAWILWHIARIEDVTMNILVAGELQVIHQDHWYAHMGVPFRDTGNAMNAEHVLRLSSDIDLEALHAYRLAVGFKTRDIVARLQWGVLANPIEPSRLRQVIDEGAVAEAARGVVEYWGRRTIAGLLLMPPTRHSFIHLNEALRIRSRA